MYDAALIDLDAFGFRSRWRPNAKMIAGLNAHADVARFLQDQPIYYCDDSSGRVEPPFLVKMAQIGGALFTDKMRAAVRKIAADAGWQEPPRFAPFTRTGEHDGKPVKVLWICPGCCPPADEMMTTLRGFLAGGFNARVTLGPTDLITWDSKDPRRDPSYPSPLRQVMEYAKLLGAEFSEA